jgi:hypothetical protein
LDIWPPVPGGICLRHGTAHLSGFREAYEAALPVGLFSSRSSQANSMYVRALRHEEPS